LSALSEWNGTQGSYSLPSTYPELSIDLRVCGCRCCNFGQVERDHTGIIQMVMGEEILNTNYIAEKLVIEITVTNTSVFGNHFIIFTGNNYIIIKGDLQTELVQERSLT